MKRNVTAEQLRAWTLEPACVGLNSSSAMCGLWGLKQMT